MVSHGILPITCYCKHPLTCPQKSSPSMASFQHLWIIGKMLVHVSRDNTSSTGSSVGSFSSHDFVNTIFTHSLHKKLRLLYDVNIWCTFCQFSFCRLQTVRQILWNTDQEVWQTRAGHCGLWRFHPVLCGAPGQWLTTKLPFSDEYP